MSRSQETRAQSPAPTAKLAFRFSPHWFKIWPQTNQEVRPLPRIPLVGRSVAVIVDGPRVLLVESKASPGHWVPPGGKIEPRERAAEAAAREVLEETGARVEVGGLIAYREVWWDGWDTLELYFAARPLADTGAQGHSGYEGRPWKWVETGDLCSVPHFPEELDLLCRLSASDDAPVAYLGATDARKMNG